MTTEELDLLYREQFGALYRFVLFKVRHTQTAEDIAQTVFVRALEALPRFKIRDDKRTEAPASAWLFTIARNLCIDHYKKHSSFTPGDETGFFSEIADVRADATESAADRERKQALAVAVSDLSESEQEFVTLYHIEEKSYQEVSAIMGKSEEALRAINHRAKKDLKTKLKQFYDDTKE